jgi:HD-like signal output (HDOD) protein
MAYVPIIARVNSLPPLPESVLKLEELFAHGDPDMSELVKIIASDPALTVDILAKVNAPLYSFSRQIISIHQAVTLFGSAKVRAMVLSSTIERNFDINLTPYGISTDMFAKISAMQSELMFQWYMGINVDMAKLLTPIAFLMETGKILISKDIMERHKEDQFLLDIQNYEKIKYVENIHVNMTTAQINALVFEHWNLNTTFIECMKYLDNENETPNAVEKEVEALQIVRRTINVKEQFSESALAFVKERMDIRGYNYDKFIVIVRRIKAKYL